MNCNDHDELAQMAGYCCHLDQMHHRHPNRAEVISWVERLRLLMVCVLHDDHSIYVVSLTFSLFTMIFATFRNLLICGDAFWTLAAEQKCLKT